ncbi:hypothetical protein OQA88_10196 [Cercophora sp. LCS_1]
MTDVAAAIEGAPPDRPPPVSALRSARPKAKRVHTRVSIAIPNSTPASHDVTGRTGGASSRYIVTTTPWAKSLILTLDGGGIRGYSSLIILRALMREIASIEQTLEPKALSSAHTERIDSDKIPDHVLRKGQYLPCHYFDYIAGTSVGGLIAIMLGMLGKSVDDCITEFQRQNKSLPLPDDLPVVGIEFPLLHRRTTWPTRRTRSFFDTFAKFSVTATAKARGNSHQQSSPTNSQGSGDAESAATADSVEFRKDTLQCQTLAWCTEVEEPHRERRPYAFATYKEDLEDTQKLISIPEVAKAITTPWSPSFKPFKLGSGQFVDGSKQIRDPTLEVLKEITTMLSEPGEPPIDLLLSLGTDEHQAWFYERLRRPSSTASEASRSREDINKEKNRSYNQYHRFEVTDIKLGFRKKYFLKEIEEATMKWLETDHQKEHLKRYAEFLVKRRRERAATVRWEVFALGVRYYCFHDECKDVDREWDGRGEFHEHLDRKHRLTKEVAKGRLDRETELDKGRRFGCA